ncbi:MAG: efflux RND transporter periplasmic adaptor subunit [Halothiobacillaceae bacterium]
MNTLSLKPMVWMGLLLGLGLSACSHETPSTRAPESAREVRAQVVMAEEVALPSTFPVAGVIEAVDSVQLSSRVMGYIRDLNVVQGQEVKKGQLLFEIDPVDTQGAVDLAKQSLVQAEAALRDAKLDYERFKSLYADEAVNKQQLEKMRMNYEVSLSRVAQAKAGLTVARGQISYTRITAPMDAIVTAKLANEGDMANPGHPVLVLEDTAHLRVRAAVPEQVFRALKLGDTVQVEVDGQTQPLIATVSRMTPTADSLAHTYPVTLDIAAPGLKSGAFARVLFPLGERKSLLIPQAAVLERAGITGVFVLNQDNVAQYRMVRTGTVQGEGQIEILAGLVVGERVLLPASGVVLQNGDKVVE